MSYERVEGAPGIRRRYPWTELNPPRFEGERKVYDGFTVPDRTPQQLSSARALAERKLGWKFRIEKADEGSTVWRVE